MSHNARMTNNEEPSGDGAAENVGEGVQPEGGELEPEGGELEPAGADRVEPEQPRKIEHTRTAGTWAAVVVATVALIVLLVFILQNLQTTSVTFLGLTGDLPVGVALLLAAAIGGLLVALVGAARILQLRRTARKPR